MEYLRRGRYCVKQPVKISDKAHCACPALVETDNKEETKAYVMTAYGDKVLPVIGPSCDFKWWPFIYQDRGHPATSDQRPLVLGGGWGNV